MSSKRILYSIRGGLLSGGPRPKSGSMSWPRSCGHMATTVRDSSHCDALFGKKTCSQGIS
eukprot:6472077-Amphidinium_carterae.1